MQSDLIGNYKRIYGIGIFVTQMEILGYVKDLPNKDEVDKLTEWAKQQMINGAKYVCRDTPMFAEMEYGDYWIH